MSYLERMARLIETAYLPSYSPANARYDGPTVDRATVDADLRSIVAAMRDCDRIRADAKS